MTEYDLAALEGLLLLAVPQDAASDQSRKLGRPVGGVEQALPRQEHRLSPDRTIEQPPQYSSSYFPSSKEVLVGVSANVLGHWNYTEKGWPFVSPLGMIFLLLLV
jgi:hypothetical protein